MKRTLNIIKYTFASIILTITLAACGGGSTTVSNSTNALDNNTTDVNSTVDSNTTSDDINSTVDSNTTSDDINSSVDNNTSTDTNTSLLSGTFIDSPVMGLKYKTESQEGYTDDEGKFYYLQDETIEFFIANISLGQVSTQSVITPFTLTNDTNTSNPSVQTINIARLLQSLDTTPANTDIINLSTNLYDVNMTNIDLTVDDDNNLQQALNEIEDQNGEIYTLMNKYEAMQNLAYYTGLPTYVKIVDVQTQITDDDVKITLELQNIPSELTYNLGDTDALEYIWRIKFDNDNSGSDSTGDLGFYIEYLTPSANSQESRDSILDFTSQSLYQYDDNTSMSNKLDISSYITNNSSKIIFDIPKSAYGDLSTITSTTSINIYTGVFQEGNSSTDTYTIGDTNQTTGD
jgi:hypothetical protein